MYTFTAAEIANALSGEMIQGTPDVVFNSVSTDTRQISPGDLFIALVGERFDAHEYIDQAVAHQASGLIISRPVSIGGGWQGPVFLVKDTLVALQELAAYNRAQFKGLVVGVTGSNGKTTTKDMITSVLEQKYKTLKTQGNFNNHIGLPLTLLELDNSYQAVVLEMGMRGLGEIDILTRIARPDGAVITNIGETHLERLGSVANIARAKGEILDYIEPRGFAVLNGDDPLVRQQAIRCRGRIVYYGTAGEVSIRAESIGNPGDTRFSCKVKSPLGAIHISLPVPGRHNILNALAAVGVGLEAGLTLEEIKLGLESLKITSMRLEIRQTKTATIIDDTYNANPASVKAALQILSDLGRERRKVAILGDMYELGQRAVEGHREVGAEAAALQIDILITVGNLAEEIALGATLAEGPPVEVISLNTNAEVKKYLERIVNPKDVILVKGSRGVKMEEIVDYLLKLDK